MVGLSRGLGLVVVSVLVAGTHMSCKTTNASGSGSKVKSEVASSRKVNLSGASANKLIQALLDSGVRDQTGAVGATNLQVKSIVCSTPVYPNAKADCEITVGQQTSNASADASETINQILMDNGGQVNDGRVGANVAIADDLECTQPVIPNPKGSCSFSAGGGSSPSPSGSNVSISGASANQLMDALTASGVTDESRLIGALNLAVDRIDCSTPVYPNAKPSCILTSGEKTLDATAAASKTLNDILMKNGGQINDGRVGANVASATAVACSKPVIPNPQGNCSFSVGSGN
jgi:hypothetical protein